MNTPDRTTAQRPNGIDRRSALKKAAVAGTLAWSAPTILSSTAGAVDVDPVTGCTLKCLPVGSGTSSVRASISCTGTGIRRDVRVTFSSPAGAIFTCPCGGQAVLGRTTVSSSQGTGQVVGNTIVVDLGRGSAGRLTVRIETLVSCTDRDGSTCRRACQTVLTTLVFLNNQGNCRGAAVTSPVTATTTCV